MCARAVYTHTTHTIHWSNKLFTWKKKNQKNDTYTHNENLMHEIQLQQQFRPNWKYFWEERTKPKNGASILFLL